MKNIGLLAKFPTERLFQFFVEGKKHVPEQGYQGFEEREPGCMNAFYQAFSYMLEHYQEPLTPTYLYNLHEIATSNLPIRKPDFTPGKLRKGGDVSFSNCGRTSNKERCNITATLLSH